MSRLRDILAPVPMKGETLPDPRFRGSLERLQDDIRQYRLSVERLIVYPVKSLAGVDIETAQASPQGFLAPGGFADRSAAIIREDENGAWKRFTQREEPALARIAADLLDDGETLRYRTPRGSSILLDVSMFQPQRGETVTCHTTGGEHVEGVLAEEHTPLTEFLRDYLGAECGYAPADLQRISILLQSASLVRDVPRTHSGDIPARTAFADVGQVLLINRGTVEFVNESIAGDPVPEDAYRPNIVVDGPANLEELIARASMRTPGKPEVHLAFGVPSTRCTVTQVDPHTGHLRTDGEPLRALRRTRPLRNNLPTMGINVAVEHAHCQDIASSANIVITQEK